VLDEDQIRLLVADMWQLHLSERVWLDRVYGYVTGQMGAPAVPEGSEPEIKDLARLSIKNVLSLVRDSFTQNLSVVGYRDALAKENGPAWEAWQRNRMDARQDEVHRPAVTYGAAYVIVTKGAEGSVWHTKSPRQLLAVYADTQVDLWPQYAFEQWVDQSDAKARWRGMLYDDTYCYPLDMGSIPTLSHDQFATSIARTAQIAEVEDAYRHGSDNCPVVRFVNERDADDMVVGEIAPLIRQQQAINAVNFDRLLVSRFGAYPQKVITGWSGTPSEVLTASARRVWAFEDPDVQTSSFPPASLDNYNGVLAEMTEAVALSAQISPSQITGRMVNVSAEALAAAEANQQRKLQSKRDSFGESWEQVFRLAAHIEGDTVTSSDESAEVVWRDTEARAFGAIVDGVTKLAAAGVPIDELVDLIPGVTQQKTQSIKDALRRNRGIDLVSALRAQPPNVSAPTPPKPSPANMPMSNGAVTG
jgi:hypothetical protein